MDSQYNSMHKISKISFFYGIILFVLLSSPMVTATDDSAVHYYLEGNYYLEIGQYSDALASYDKATAINPNYVEAWSNRGAALGKLGRNNEDLASINKAIAINPKDCNLWYNRGVTLSRLGRDTEAVASYDKAIAINPYYANAWYNRGNALGKLGQTTESVASYDNAIAINPNLAVTIENRDILLKEQNKVQKTTTTPTLIQQQTRQQTTTEPKKSTANGDFIRDGFVISLILLIPGIPILIIGIICKVIDRLIKPLLGSTIHGIATKTSMGTFFVVLLFLISIPQLIEGIAIPVGWWLCKWGSVYFIIVSALIWIPRFL